VLNYATSAAIDDGLADRLAKGISKPLFIIGWQGKVDSNAMNAFTEVFYAVLRGQKDGKRDYAGAFEKAKTSLIRCNMNCNFEPDDADALLRLRTGPPAKPRVVTVGVLKAFSTTSNTSTTAAATATASEASTSPSASTSTTARRGSFKAASGAALNVVRRSNAGPAAFLSHCWGKYQAGIGHATHQQVKRIYERLMALGLKCWFDESKDGFQAADNLGRAMCKGIDEAAVFVSFINQEYIRKVSSDDPQDNCQKVIYTCMIACLAYKHSNIHAYLHTQTHTSYTHTHIHTYRSSTMPR